MKPSPFPVLLVIAALFGTSLACGVSGQPQPRQETPPVNLGMATELRDLEPFLPELARAAGVNFNVTYHADIDLSRIIAEGAGTEAGADSVDIAWLASGRILSLMRPQGATSQEPTMRSPLILGLKMSKAKDWGWVDSSGKPTPVTWADIAAKINAGLLHYALSSPASDHSGLGVLLSAAQALSSKGGAINEADVISLDYQLRGFIDGQALTADGAGDLAQKYSAHQGEVDGLFDYESTLMEMNLGNQIQEKLALIYPQDGVISADYPLVLVNPTQRGVYARLAAYIRSDSFQKKLAEQTFRRPVKPLASSASLSLTAAGGAPDLLVELPFPSSLVVVNQLTRLYVEQKTYASYSIYVLDTSLNMAGSSIQAIQEAFHELAEPGAAPVFQNRELLTLLAYNHKVGPRFDFKLDAARPDGLKQAAGFISSLTPSGNTATYSALIAAYQLASESLAQAESSPVKVVLIAGEASKLGETEDDFRAFYTAHPALSGVPLYTVHLGDWDTAPLQRLADLTKGHFYDASRQPLVDILKDIESH